MKTLKLLLLIPILLCCENTTKNSNRVSAGLTVTKMAAIVLEMEGNTHSIQQEELMPIQLNFESDSLLYSLYTKDYPVQINFNLFNTQALQKGTVDYTIPEANAGQVKVDLSFFNNEREAKRINKRVVFRDGTIHIEEITAHSLKMSFAGKASGMLDRENSFPVYGSINIIY